MTQLRALADRRAATRLPDPTCLRCDDGGSMIGVIRTTRFVYFRCAICGDVQPKPMPALTLSHGLVARLFE